MPDFVLTEENYYSPEAGIAYCSVSQLKSFRRCEASTLAELKGEYVREPSDSMLVGSTVDCMLLTPEDLPKFFEAHPEMISSRGATKGQLLQKFSHCYTMANRAKKDKKFVACLNGDHQQILTGKIFGVPFRAKLDVLNLEKGYITDLKTTADPSKEFYNKSLGHYENFAQHFGYALQGAVYQELVYQNFGKRLPFYLAVISSQAHPRLEILSIDQQSMDEALMEYEPLIEAIPKLKSGEIEPTPCHECDWCADNLPVEIHDWLHREEVDE